MNPCLESMKDLCQAIKCEIGECQSLEEAKQQVYDFMILLEATEKLERGEKP